MQHRDSTHKTNDLITSDKGLLPVLVLLDLSAAFDTNDDYVLFHRLEYLIGIKGSALKEVHYTVRSPICQMGFSLYMFMINPP